MIKEHKIIPLFVNDGKDKMEMEFNWNSDEEISDGKMMRLKWKDKEWYVNTGDLYLVILALVEKDKQKKLVQPFAKFEKIEYRPTTISFKATRNITKGEYITTVIEAPIKTIDYTDNKNFKDKMIFMPKVDNKPSHSSNELKMK